VVETSFDSPKNMPTPLLKIILVNEGHDLATEPVSAVAEVDDPAVQHEQDQQPCQGA
jgi:hypothetical protein